MLLCPVLGGADSVIVIWLIAGGNLAKYTSPEDIQIAALQKKQVTAVDLMTMGRGIPWEDRGSIGFFGAFFKTCWMALFSPIQLVSSMRRPETSKDAKIFAYWIGGVWLLVVGIQSAFNYFVFYSKVDSLIGQQYVINTALEGLAAGIAAVFMPRIISWMFYRLTAFDMTSKAPPVLVFNTITYLCGVSIVALIPGGSKPLMMVGPYVAGIWMFFLLIFVGIRRLHIRVGAAIIGSVVTTLGCAAIVAGGWLGLWLIWCQLMGNDSMPAPPAPTQTQMR